jgi:hypothetical protein
MTATIKPQQPCRYQANQRASSTAERKVRNAQTTKGIARFGPRGRRIHPTPPCGALRDAPEEIGKLGYCRWINLTQLDGQCVAQANSLLPSWARRLGRHPLTPPYTPRLWPLAPGAPRTSDEGHMPTGGEPPSQGHLPAGAPRAPSRMVWLDQRTALPTMSAPGERRHLGAERVRRF